MLSVRRHLGWLLALALAVSAAAATRALADGDPASDYLISQSTYLSPYDAKVSRAQADNLNALVADARKQGLPLKVAVIFSAYDLGAVPILFGHPQRYATFLAAEDFYYWKDELLVVMPAGYGVAKAKALPAADKALVARLPPPRSKTGDELVAAASQAVIRLAALHGITLSPTAQSSGSSTNSDRTLIAAVVLAAGLLALAIRLVRRRRSR